MGFLDNVKSQLRGHSKEVNTAVEKAGDLIDKETGGKYAKQVDQGQAKVEEIIEKND